MKRLCPYEVRKHEGRAATTEGGTCLRSISAPPIKKTKLAKKVVEATVSKEHNTAFLKTRLMY